MTARRAEWAGLAALLIAAVLAWLLVPTYPNFDAYFHLDWGRQVLHGHAPSFRAFAAPTEHPLYVGVCALLALAGRQGDRLLVLFTVLCWVGLVYGTFRLGRAVFGRVPGLLAAFFIGSSFAFLLYAAKAFVDMPFVTLVIWAGVLAAERGRTRPFGVMTLLTLAGLLRPEAWPLAGVWWLWCARGPVTELRPRVALAALAVLAPAGWALVDALVTGDALFSIHSTSALAGALGRLRSRTALPGELVSFLASAVRPPVALAALAGLVLGWRRLGARAMIVPLALLADGVLAFLGLGLIGQPVIPRYLTVPAVALCVFAGYAAGGWAGAPPGGSGRRLWSRVALGGAVAGVLFVALSLGKFSRLAEEVRFVRTSHDQLTTLLRDPAVTAARRCGPLAFPTYRLVPDSRWILDVLDLDVAARSDPARRHGGPVVIVSGRKDVERYGLAEAIRPSTNLHPRGSRPVARSGPFTVYSKGCAAAS